jgi:glycosyltransferase involved in cell wall biosynthesis
LVYKDINLTILKILHVIQTMSPRHGGPATVLKALAGEQARAGHEVTLCTTNHDYPHGHMDVPTNSPVKKANLTIWYYRAHFAPLLFSIRLVSWLRRSIKRFDIVHIHGLYRFPVTYAAWQARRARVPYLIRPHGSLDPFLCKQSRYNLFLKRVYERLFDIPNLNHAAAIHYTAQKEAQLTTFLGLRAKPVVVPNGIDWGSYKELPLRGAFRGSLGLSAQTPLVLFLGRINFKKGLDLLVPAFSRVVEQYPGARLAIVGPDNEGYGRKVRQWCEEYGIMNKVFFVDYLGPEEVKQAYVDGEVFVLPSYTENFGMTVVEAMACGCPVVISDQVNIWREVQQEKAGLVVQLDPSKIASVICRVLSDKDAAGEMGRRGRVAARRRYSWPRIVDQMTQVYWEVIEETAVRRRSESDR